VIFITLADITFPVHPGSAWNIESQQFPNVWQIEPIGKYLRIVAFP
jgi:hypothetical protein